MKNPVFSAYDWYDNQKEPWRFILFFFPAMFLIMGSHGTNHVFAVICVFLLFLAMFTRFAHLYGKQLVVFCKKMLKKKERKND